MNFEQRMYEWMRSCLRKKRLKEKWANDIINRAAKEGTKLNKYKCSHCGSWHVTKKKGWK